MDWLNPSTAQLPPSPLTRPAQPRSNHQPNDHHNPRLRHIQLIAYLATRRSLPSPASVPPPARYRSSAGMAAIDFDDLVATMKGSGIGQEAMDLRALHVRLLSRSNTSLS